MQPNPAAAIANRGYSLIQDCGYYSSSCGYCKDEDSSASSGKSAHGMHAHRLTVYDYQELLDQGWRRSGKFLYKPDNKATCCCQYTIRLDVTEFAPSKAHRKLLRKWEQFLAGTHTQQAHQQAQAPSSPRSSSSPQQPDRHTASPKRARTNGTSPAQGQQEQNQRQLHNSSDGSQVRDQVCSLLQAAVFELQAACSSGCNTQLLPAVRVLPVPRQQHQQHKHKPSWLPGTVCTSPCAHALAAAVRKHTSQQQQQPTAPSLQAADGTSSNSSSSGSSLWVQPSQLAQGLADRFNRLAAAAQLPVMLTAAASKGHINFLQQQQQQQQQQGTAMQEDADGQAQQRATEQQQEAHNSSRSSVLQKQVAGSQQQQHQHQHQHQQQQQHQLEVRMVPNQFIQEEFLLWQRYQAQQHHEPLDELTPSHYKGFLVDTPLVHVPPQPPQQPAAGAAGAGAQQAAGQQQQQDQAGAAAAGTPSCGYGSFHQQYWLDGKLVAVGVVDVLPRCLSSKYFFWDPDYAWLSLGRYGALREISWVAGQHDAGAGDFKYYYLGFYIHTCPKMAYKAEYPPSELLCPQRQVWVRVDDNVRQAFDRTPYVVLSDLPRVHMRPNLSVPRQPPAAGAQQVAATGSGGADGFSGLDGSQHEQQQQRERQALDGQLLFVMKQPVRWGVLRSSGLLDDEDVAMLEEKLAAWRAAVGETARTLLYAATPDMLPF